VRLRKDLSDPLEMTQERPMGNSESVGLYHANGLVMNRHSHLRISSRFCESFCWLRVKEPERRSIRRVTEERASLVEYSSKIVFRVLDVLRGTSSKTCRSLPLLRGWKWAGTHAGVHLDAQPRHGAFLETVSCAWSRMAARPRKQRS
jgi:hypothetical protein